MGRHRPKPTRALRQQVRGDFSGLLVTSEAVKDIGYAIGVVGDAELQTGGGLIGGASAGSPDGEPPEASYHRSRVWTTIGTALPEPKENDFTGSVSVAYQLNPGEEKTVHFVLAWMAPMWIGEARHTFVHKMPSDSRALCKLRNISAAITIPCFAASWAGRV